MGQFSAEKPVAPGSVLSGNQQKALCAKQPTLSTTTVRWAPGCSGNTSPNDYRVTRQLASARALKTYFVDTRRLGACGTLASTVEATAARGRLVKHNWKVRNPRDCDVHRRDLQ